MSTLDDIYAKAYLNNKPYITVHDGTFHADDVAATALASKLFGGSDNVKIIRTRNPKKFKGLTLDVGEGDFDHHGSRYEIDEDGIPYSAFSRLYSSIKDKLLPDDISRTHFKRTLVDPVSKLDNGIALTPGERSYFSWVPSFNNNFTEGHNQSLQDKRFRSSVQMSEQIIDREIQNALASIKAKKKKEEILQQAKDKEVVEIPTGIDINKELASTNAKFTLTKSDDGTYKLRSVPKSSKKLFSKKVPFPKSWAGLSGDDLKHVSGFDDATFCHSNGFLAGFKSHDSAIRAAKLLLKEKKKKSILNHN